MNQKLYSINSSGGDMILRSEIQKPGQNETVQQTNVHSNRVCSAALQYLICCFLIGTRQIKAAWKWQPLNLGCLVILNSVQPWVQTWTDAAFSLLSFWPSLYFRCSFNFHTPDPFKLYDKLFEL